MLNEIELQEFENLLEDGYINILPDSISLAYVLQNDNGLWEVYTNSGFKVGEFQDKTLAIKKATSMRLYAKDLLGKTITEKNIDKTWNPETGSSPDQKNINKEEAYKRKERKYSNNNITVEPEEKNNISIKEENNQENIEEKPPEEINTIPIMEDSKILKEFTLFRDGEWDFEKDLGITFKVDKEFRKKILENWNNKTRGQKIPVVDSHDPSKPAYGWLSKMWDNGDRTMIEVRWNKFGNEVLENEGYGYHSPQAKFDYYDPESKKHYGPTLIELTLTNSPRIKVSSAVLREFSEDFSDYGNEYIKLEELGYSEREDLPDSAFALIEEINGQKIRKLPYKNKDGSINKSHVRNALARINQVKGFSKSAKEKALAKLMRASKKVDIEVNADIKFSENIIEYNQPILLINELNNLIYISRNINEFIPNSIEMDYLGTSGIVVVYGKSIISDIGECLCQSIRFNKNKWNEKSVNNFIEQFNIIDRCLFDGSNFINDMRCNYNNMIEQFSNKYNNNFKEDENNGKKEGQERWMQIMENEQEVVNVEVSIEPKKEEKVENVDNMLSMLIGKVMNFFSQKEKEIEEKKEEENMEKESVAVMASEEVKEEVKEETNISKEDVKLLLAEISNLKQKNNELEIKLNEAKEKEEESKDSILLEELINDGKILPMDKEEHMNYIKKLRNTDNAVKKSGIKLSESESVSLEEDYKNMLKNKNKVIEYNKEKGSSNMTIGDGINLEEIITSEALKLSSDNSISLADAIVEVNKKYNYQPPREKGGK